MDLSLQILTCWQFVLFTLGIAGLTWVVRIIVEFFLSKDSVPMNKTSKIWTELLLPIGPVITGALLGILFQQYPYPEGIVSTSARAFFGLVAGLFSGLAYKIIKGMLNKKVEEISSKSPEELVNEIKDTITKE